MEPLLDAIVERLGGGEEAAPEDRAADEGSWSPV
jgi:hypothetical protein